MLNLHYNVLIIIEEVFVKDIIKYAYLFTLEVYTHQKLYRE